MGARALLDINLIWFGYIARLRGVFYLFKRFLPVFSGPGGVGVGVTTHRPVVSVLSPTNQAT